MTDERLSEAERLRQALRELSPERRALLSMNLRRKQAPEHPLSRLPARTVSAGRYASSPGQERLYFLHELDPASVTYLLPIVLRLRGAARTDALHAALEGMAARHEPLRTGFEVDSERGLVQVVRAAGEAGVELLRGSGTAAEVDGHIRQLTRRPFDLAQPPLMRAGLWRVRSADEPADAPDDRPDAEWVFAMCVHHIAVDGWSLGVLVRELAELYAAAAEGRSPELPELPVQYVDFATGPHELRDEEETARQLGYWERTLSGAPPLEIPSDRPRPNRPTFDGASLPVAVNPGLTAELGRVARTENATPFMAMLAVFSVVLHRWSGQSDLVVGTPVAGRPWPELEGLVGFFVNTLALRIDLADTVTFRDVLRRVRDVCLEGFENQDVPFEQVVQQADVGRQHGRPDLPRALLALRNVPLDAPRLAGLDVTTDELPRTGTDVDLGLELAPDESGGLSGWLVYSTDLFDTDTVQRLADAVHAVLTAVTADADRPLRALPVLTADEHDRVIRELSGAAVAPCPAETLAERFEQQADATPDAVAVIADGAPDGGLTYRELDERSSRLAHWLLRSGMGPEDRVGVHLHRGTELAVALLAVLKCGAVYLPLDPGHPAERLEQLVRDAAPRLVLTDTVTASATGWGGTPEDGPATVRLDAPDAVWLDGPAARPGVRAQPEGAVCVLYTSGSTGTPKGVVMTQHGLTNRMRWMADTFGFGAGDVVLHKTPISSDPSLWEMLVPLITGGRVVMSEPQQHTDPGYVLGALTRHSVTACDFVPAMLRAALADAEFAVSAKRLRLVVCGGEELPVPAARRFLELAPQAALCNFYGPTEVACDATFHQLSAPVPAPVPIGGPAAGVETYVLDQDGRVQPVGVPGELFLGGVQIARGYLGRPAQTAAAFVPHPFDPGKRLYRTGDRARCLADGTLEYLGRLDQQVKIRGYRVEPGEVEAVLRAHPGVEEAVVMVRARGEDEHELVGYLTVPAGSRLPDRKELSRHLGRTLPTPMIPASYVVLDSLPLLTNGKVDRKALPEPGRGGTVLRSERVEPVGALQRVLAHIWQQVLGAEQVGAQDDFFELGGHSLLATQVVSQVRELFRMEFPLHFFVEAPTVAAFADLVRERGTADGVDVDRIAELVLKVQEMSSSEVGTKLREDTAEGPSPAPAGERAHGSDG